MWHDSPDSWRKVRSATRDDSSRSPSRRQAWVHPPPLLLVCPRSQASRQWPILSKKTNAPYINRTRCTPSPRPSPSSLLSALAMFVAQFVGLALATIGLFLRPVAAVNKTCQNPTVRREWRSLPPQERAQWITAVKVNCPLRMSPVNVQLIPACAVPKKHPPQLFFDTLLQYFILEDSSYQPKFFVLRWCACFVEPQVHLLILGQILFTFIWISILSCVHSSSSSYDA